MPTAKTSWTSFSSAALGWLYPPQCALCTRIGEPAVCEVCASEMRALKPLHEDRSDALLSFRLSAYEYEGRAAQAVKRLKYSRATSLSAFMAAAVYETAANAGLISDRLVIPVPIHWSRRAARGFNQAELLSESFPKDSIGRGALIRTRRTASQAGLNLDQRQRNLIGAFEARSVPPTARVTLIDDVLTTGQTARECARVLLEAGALEVGLVTFAADL